MPDVSHSIDEHFGSVRVYIPIDPDVLFANARRITAELFGMRDLRDGARTFEVHPASGYLSYADHDELWKNPAGRDLPRDKGAVVAIAREFFGTANRKILGSRVLRQEQVPALFPEDLRPAWFGGVVPKSSSTPDHVLCQFGAYLQADRQRTARVEGAAIDVRIGRRGKVIGLSSRWRPLVGDLLSREPADPDAEAPLYADSPTAIRKPGSAGVAPIDPPAVPAPPQPSSAQDHQNHIEEVPAEYVYWLADENAPQTFVAPMLLRRNGHHGAIVPASAHSLYVEIWQRRAGEQLEAGAVVYGGSGSYEYQWASWHHGSIFDSGITLAGTAATASFNRDVHNVVLRVRDVATGAVAETEEVVFPSS